MLKKGTPMKGTPMKGTPMKGTPMKGTLLEGIPSELPEEIFDTICSAERVKINLSVLRTLNVERCGHVG
jgi:hypothetical protein